MYVHVYYRTGVCTGGLEVLSVEEVWYPQFLQHLEIWNSQQEYNNEIQNVR